MGRSSPIRTRPWKRPPWKRRHRSGFWFIPPVSDGVATDAEASCWADDDTPLLMKGASPSGLQLLRIPILWNAQETFDPQAIANLTGVSSESSKYLAHPLAEKWRLERIVGDVLIQGQHVTLGINDCVPTGPMLVNFSFQHTNTLGDAVVVYDPEANDAAIGRHRFHERRVFLSQEFVGCHQCDTDSTGSNTGDTTGHTGSTVTAFMRFGCPTARVVHFDLRPKLTVRPESTVTLVMTATSSCKDQDTVFVLPKLKAWLSKAA